jgi:hypothetical protein
MSNSRIFTNAELKSIEERQKGNKRDNTGIFSARVKPKIIELFEVWFPKKRQLKKLIKKQRR